MNILCTFHVFIYEYGPCEVSGNLKTVSNASIGK